MGQQNRNQSAIQRPWKVEGCLKELTMIWQEKLKRPILLLIDVKKLVVCTEKKINNQIFASLSD